MSRGRLAGAALALAGTADVQAARPMIIDDARLLDAKACQLEAWIRRDPHSTEYWALPACNFTGNLELTFGGARTHADSQGLTDTVLQGKTSLRTMETNGWGAAVVLGTVRHPRRALENDWPGDTYVNVPFSKSMDDDRWTVHVNAGTAYRRDEKRLVPTWGLGVEIDLSADLQFIPEVFHFDPGRPRYQVGMRYELVKDVVQLDATYGGRFLSDGERWFTIGLRFQTPPFIR